MNRRRSYDNDIPRMIAVLIIAIVITVLATQCVASHAHATWRADSDWHWDSVANATGYRLRWSTQPDVWCRADHTDISTYACTLNDCHGEIAMPAGDLVFIVVTAYNAIGESPTEHGAIVDCLTP